MKFRLTTARPQQRAKSRGHKIRLVFLLSFSSIFLFETKKGTWVLSLFEDNKAKKPTINPKVNLTETAKKKTFAQPGRQTKISSPKQSFFPAGWCIAGPEGFLFFLNLKQ